jgi:hypothetical protein
VKWATSKIATEKRSCAPIRQAGYQIRGRRPAQRLLHLAAHEGVEGLQARLRYPVGGLHQLQEESGYLAAAERREIHALLDRAPDAPPQDREVLYYPDGITPQLVLSLGYLCHQSVNGAALAEGLYGVRTAQELDKNRDQVLHRGGQPGIGSVLDVPATRLPPRGNDLRKILADPVGYVRRALHIS